MRILKKVENYSLICEKRKTYLISLIFKSFCSDAWSRMAWMDENAKAASFNYRFQNSLSTYNLHLPLSIFMFSLSILAFYISYFPFYSYFSQLSFSFSVWFLNVVSLFQNHVWILVFLISVSSSFSLSVDWCNLTWFFLFIIIPSLLVYSEKISTVPGTNISLLFCFKASVPTKYVKTLGIQF